MRVLMLSKACIVGQYQTKLTALAKQRDLELTVVVPPYWRDERGILPLERVHTEGYQLLVEPMSFNGAFHLHFYPTLPKVLGRIRPDLVHIDEEPYNFATFHALLAAKRAGSRALFFSWQNLMRRYPPPFAWMESYVLRHSDGAIAGSQQAAQVLRAKNYRGPLCVIPQFGLDPEIYKPRSAEPCSDTTFRIGFIGRFVEEKGIEVLLRAVAGMQGNWRLCLLGSGPLKSHLEALARQLRIADRVEFCRWRPSTEMPSHYCDLDLIVVPSVSRPNWKEQFGRVLIEAMASEVPVIGSDCGEIPNVIGNAGLLFPENDSIKLRAQIESLYLDPVRRTKLGKLGRQRVLAHYTQDQVANDTFGVYQHILPHDTIGT